LAGVAVALATASYLLLQDVVTVVVIAIVAVIFGILAGRKPRTLEYSVSDDGVRIASALHPYHDFKSFSVNEEGVLHSIILLPIKRFMPVLTIYFEQKDEDRIVDTVSAYLPFEQHKPSAVDRLMERIRF
jgi:hypothetical protein